MKRIGIAAVLLALVGLAGCTNWERTTFQTLSATHSALESARLAYEASATAPCSTVTGPCIPHSKLAYASISEANNAQNLAVDAMIAYEGLKGGGATSTALDAAKAKVEAALAALPVLIADVKALYYIGKGVQQ